MLSVIIGRFQTPYLHAGHLKLISEAEKHGDKVLILIGTTAATGTDKNPLDYRTRELMLINHFLKLSTFDTSEKFKVKELKDNLSDENWSEEIDKLIKSFNSTDDEVLIFGGRDNSLNVYSGIHKTKIIDEVLNISSSSLREEGSYPEISEDFRSGIIYHTQNRYPIVYSTVDVALIRFSSIDESLYCSGKEVLMGNKGDGFHFIGGFVDPSDESHEKAALRELNEETGIELDYLNFRFSLKVKDKRYGGTKDSIMTNLFTYSGYCQLPKQEDIKDNEFKEFQWIPLEEKSLEKVSETHKPLFDKLLVRI